MHNTYQLDGIEKNILTGPLTISPKPLWFATHSNPEAVGWRLLRIWPRDKPSLWNLGGALGSAVVNGPLIQLRARQIGDVGHRRDWPLCHWPARTSLRADVDQEFRRRGREAPLIEWDQA